MFPMMLVAALLSWFLVGLFINISKAQGWGQPVRKDGSKSDLGKEGTPTAGGVPFVVALALFGAFIAFQVRGILRSRHPRLQAIRAVAVGLPLLWVVFASAYWIVAAEQADAKAGIAGATPRSDTAEKVF